MQKSLSLTNKVLNDVVSGLSIETAKLLGHIYSRKASPKSIYVITKNYKSD